ncbi:succinate dehydrogenase assembly factor 2 [Thermodesulforhabdus norvegica]|uniref:FAD assembly factor SdhE n=1 Tax=Thermodesulforhabdus norvegica TaxID=39841 RepID=A0A1I4V145_9BACT|nr:succinate dehydrogenase assembly factor 2 [Thermodesulforhabdus norvegica]SFM94845.1 Succinate dehydrogenase flavin-adding protein, antitoxin component of the CptAB toxin-antitoxin module [Thermodesulforhabdus norvegica]
MVDRELIRRRIRYHLSKRSSLEVELILRSFWEAKGSQLTDSELADFEKILELDDIDFLKIMSGKKSLPDGYPAEMFGMIRSFWLNRTVR